MTDQEKIEKLREALAWLVDECETNYAFASEDAGEKRCLENAENILEETKGV